MRDEIIARLSDNLARDSAHAMANDLLASLQGGESELEALATDTGLEYGHHDAVKRGSQTPDAKLVQEIFRLPVPAEGEAVSVVLETTSGFAVVQLESVVQGDLETGPAFAQQQYQRVIANGNASLETAALMRQLRNTADVEVFEDRIK